MAFLGDEEGATWDVQNGQSNSGSRSDGGGNSLIVLDNVLTVYESAGGKEQAGWPHSCSGGLLEGLG
jgi:hypothetical protein